ncbi:hypothetical protein MUK70_08385 [Dyadobacter chenwenxiniae]|uniref:Uncharacterized protein n=1 Tax=Dyadobacter chenwenxiniae TaxID=2906456 RepID=A0A9X1PM84_9BACT|nr:hypothetical protein [Dyadobacter chenwenxiniae]MCF0062824.1 hypothetical protein [Dyadobacter chenwenxiniae]UON85001.1 hypothetical protein MUK70_08385 [Dyadobacter chenwenxiniae]
MKHFFDCLIRRKQLATQYLEAIALLETAWEKEHRLGYSEQPSYARPVLIGLAEVHQQAGDSKVRLRRMKSC